MLLLTGLFGVEEDGIIQSEPVLLKGKKVDRIRPMQSAQHDLTDFYKVRRMR
jgi:hypothetical protein